MLNGSLPTRLVTLTLSALITEVLCEQFGERGFLIICAPKAASGPETAIAPPE